MGFKAPLAQHLGILERFLLQTQTEPENCHGKMMEIYIEFVMFFLTQNWETISQGETCKKDILNICPSESAEQISFRMLKLGAGCLDVQQHDSALRKASQLYFNKKI